MTPWESVCAQFRVSPAKNQHMVRCVCHADSTASLSIKGTPDGGVLLFCFAGCRGADVRQALGVPAAGAGGARKRVSMEPDPSARRIVAEYVYRDAIGDTLAIKRRWYPKTFDWMAWDVPQQRMRTGLPASGQGGLPLYRLPEVLSAAGAGVPILVVEGEKDADNLAALGYVATTVPEGASGAGSAYDALRWSPCAGADVILLPDCDDAGRAHAERLVDVLLPICAVVSVLTLPDVPPKGDVSDWLALPGRDRQALDYLLYHAIPQGRDRQALGDALLEDFEERAAVREHDGGMSRADAERLARSDVSARFASLPTAERLALAATDIHLVDALRRLGQQVR